MAISAGTGFMGKVLIEKLLRITEVEKIYLLMRAKKGKNPKDRLVDMFANPVSSNAFSFRSCLLNSCVNFSFLTLLRRAWDWRG
jgi:NAD dependent epimerase/dehydratase family enzyme